MSAEQTPPQMTEEQRFQAAIQAAVMTALAPLQEELASIRRENRFLNSNNESLKRQLEEALDPSTGTITSSPGEGVKITTPTEFTGEKDSIEAETFITQVGLYLSQFPKATERKKLAFMLSLLKGTAGKWAQPYVKKFAEYEITEEEFEQEFIKMWFTVDREGKAIRELETLKQGSSSVPDYVAAFRQKAAYTEYSDYDLRHKFRTGLSTRIKEQLAQIPLKKKDTLDKLIGVCVQIGQNFEEIDAEKKRSSWWTPKGKARDNTFNQGTAPAAKDSDAMDVDSGKGKGTPRAAGKKPAFLCYRCGGEGHMARNCTGAPKAQVKATAPEAEVKASSLGESAPPKWFADWLASKEGKDF